MDEVWVQDHLVKVKSSVEHNSGKADWSVACYVGRLAFRVLAVFGASDKVVELLAAIARVDLKCVAAGVTKRLEKKSDKSVYVQPTYSDGMLLSMWNPSAILLAVNSE